MSERSGKYRLGPPLGGGGMAEVFRATLIGAEGFSRAVAIKRVLPGYSADPGFAEMFVAEARIASMLTHPSVVPVIDFDRDDDGRLFLVMELVEGKDLRALGMTGRLPVRVTVHVIAELLRGLGYAHALEFEGRPMSIVHRDVSPHNVLVSWEGAVKLTDFGIAKAAAASPVTRTGVVKGKVAYLSPEQARAETIDGRSDIFAVGIILHELLTGSRLFAVKTGAPDAVIVHRVLNLDIPSPRAFAPEISSDLEAVCMRLLARNKTDRFSDAKAALEALVGCPEVTARGQMDLATLMTERFPHEAPSSASHRLTHVPTQAPEGGFTESGAGAAPSPATRRERPSGPTAVEDTTPAGTFITPTRMLADDTNLAGPSRQTALYLGAAVFLFLVSLFLGWRLWIEPAQQIAAERIDVPEPMAAPTVVRKIEMVPPAAPTDAGARPEVAKPETRRGRKKARIRRKRTPPVVEAAPKTIAPKPEAAVVAPTSKPISADPPPAVVRPPPPPPPKKIGDDILRPDL